MSVLLGASDLPYIIKVILQTVEQMCEKQVAGIHTATKQHAHPKLLAYTGTDCCTLHKCQN